MWHKTALLVSLLLLPLFAAAQDTIPPAAPAKTDYVLIRPDIYAYAEGLGPGRFFSINGEKLALKMKDGTHGIYVRAGFAWLPDLSARYTMSLLGGLNFESGRKSWSRDFGIGMTAWIDRYNWKRTDSLTTMAVGPGQEPTLLWGPYLSLGVRYRWDKEIFCGFEFTPVALKGADGWSIMPSIGVSVGFMLNPGKG